MAMALEPQHTLNLQATKPSTKRKPSARAAFRLDEIPKVAAAMTGTYALRDQLLFRRSDPRKQREIALKVARRMFADMAA
jgi:hypothetical protein